MVQSCSILEQGRDRNYKLIFFQREISQVINGLQDLMREAQFIQSYKFLTTIMQMYKLPPMFRNYKYLMSLHSHGDVVSPH